MCNKVKNSFCVFCKAVLFAGIIVLFIGLYYSVIKAGIPYQDPPIELQIEYAINYGIGEVLSKTGCIIMIIGGLLCFIKRNM